MKKELKEQTNRMKSIMEQIDDVTHRAFSNVETKEQYFDDDLGDAEDFERESLRNDDEAEREYVVELSDHVYVSIDTYHLSAGHERGEDSIDITVKGNRDSGDLRIVNVDPVGEYTEEEIQRATEMAKESLNKLPTGFSFDLKSQTGEAEGIPIKSKDFQ